MARRKNRTAVSYAPMSRRRRYYGRVRSAGKKYSQRKNWALKKYAKKAGYGALAGMALAVPVSLAAKYLGQPALLEVADRGGSVAASFGGGPMGVAAYQVADALFDRFVIFENASVSGSRNGGYL